MLSKELTSDEKLNIIETEYDIPIEDTIRKDVSVTCNLSQGIREDGKAIGETKIILSMHEKGYTIEQIAEVAEKSLSEIKAIIEKRTPILT